MSVWVEVCEWVSEWVVCECVRAACEREERKRRGVCVCVCVCMYTYRTQSHIFIHNESRQLRRDMRLKRARGRHVVLQKVGVIDLGVCVCVCLCVCV